MRSPGTEPDLPKATAEEVARAAAFLASSRASYVTGQMLVLDGGYSI